MAGFLSSMRKSSDCLWHVTVFIVQCILEVFWYIVWRVINTLQITCLAHKLSVIFASLKLEVFCELPTPWQVDICCSLSDFSLYSWNMNMRLFKRKERVKMLTIGCLNYSVKYLHGLCSLNGLYSCNRNVKLFKMKIMDMKIMKMFIGLLFMVSLEQEEEWDNFSKSINVYCSRETLLTILQQWL